MRKGLTRQAGRSRAKRRADWGKAALSFSQASLRLAGEGGADGETHAHLCKDGDECRAEWPQGDWAEVGGGPWLTPLSPRALAVMGSSALASVQMAVASVVVMSLPVTSSRGTSLTGGAPWAIRRS